MAYQDLSRIVSCSAVATPLDAGSEPGMTEYQGTTMDNMDRHSCCLRVTSTNALPQPCHEPANLFQEMPDLRL